VYLDLFSPRWLYIEEGHRASGLTHGGDG